MFNTIIKNNFTNESTLYFNASLKVELINRFMLAQGLDANDVVDRLKTPTPVTTIREAILFPKDEDRELLTAILDSVMPSGTKFEIFQTVNIESPIAVKP